MKIAYLVNTYPSPSHSFIRREIAALETQSVAICRFALRSANEANGPDERDERSKTHYILDAGKLNLLAAALLVFLQHPLRWFRAASFAARIGFRSDAGVIRHLIYLIEACTLLQWTAGEAVAHVHAHFGTNATTVAMFCKMLGGPTFSFTAHGPEEFDKPAALALAEKIESAAFVVAVCSFGRSQLFRWCSREHWDKIHIVRCGVDQLFLDTASSPIDASTNLLQVGRLCEQKGQLLLLDAARRVADRGVAFHLTLVGDGELRRELQRRIAEHGLQEKVTLAGWKTGPEIRQLMLDSRVVLMPSFAEGLPVVLMESLALKRPVISTFVAGIPELVSDGANGWLVPAGDSAALAEAIEKALRATPDELSRLGSAGRDVVLQRHDAGREAARLVTLFRSAIGEAATHAVPAELSIASV